MLNELLTYLQFPFVRNAFIVGVLISLCSSLLGIVLVLRRFSFIGDGLSHVAFGAMAIAGIFKLANQMILVLPVTIISAIILLKANQNKKIKADAAVAMISVASLAIGYILMNKFSSSANISGDVCTTLFGSTSILTLKRSEVYLSMALSVLVLLLYIFFYNKIFAITFDENFTKASGMNTDLINLVISCVIAIVVVLAMNLVGSLLISALLIFPVLSAMRIFNSFKMVSIFSALISVFCACVGIVISILVSTPVGSTIVVIEVIAFVLCYIIGEIKK